MKPTLLRLTLAAAACVLSLFPDAHAQQPAATPTPVAEPVAAPLDPKVLKQFEAILTQKFTREPADIFRALERTSPADSMTATDRFFAAFRAGDWGKIREQLGQMPPDLARRIYDKMLTDLTEKQKPNVRLDDVLGLADAVPGEFTGDQVHRLGQLLGLAVPANESYWLSDRLKKGTDKLGGTDPAKRLLAGRVALAGGFKELARAYLPPLEKVEQIADEGLRNELTGFLTSQRESEAAQRGQVQKIWDENLRTLTLGKVTDLEKTKAGSALAKVITQIPQTTLAPVFGEMVKSNPEGAVRLVGALGIKLQNEARGEVAVRTENLKAQASIANLLAENVDLSTQPWNQLAQMMAEFWIGEAENAFTNKTADSNAKQKFVAPEELHLVFSTKERRPFLRDQGIRTLLHAYLGGVSKTLECPSLIVGGVEDHVHLLCRFGRTITQAEWVKELKRVSNGWLKEQGPSYAEFQWQAGYADFSISQSNLEQVKQYIAGQEEHHRKMTFQDELRALLRRHEMEFDERYVWD